MSAAGRSGTACGMALLERPGSSPTSGRSHGTLEIMKLADSLPRVLRKSCLVHAGRARAHRCPSGSSAASPSRGAAADGVVQAGTPASAKSAFVALAFDTSTGQVLGGRIVGDGVDDLERQLRRAAAEQRPMPLAIACAERVVDVHEHRGAAAPCSSPGTDRPRCSASAPVISIGAVWKLRNDELVALLGDLRRGRDVDDRAARRAARRPGRWRRSAPESKAPTSMCGAGIDRLLGLGAAPRRAWSRCRSSRSRASPPSSCRRSTLVGHVGAAAAGLADLRLATRGRQQQRDLEVGSGACAKRMTQAAAARRSARAPASAVLPRRRRVNPVRLVMASPP